MSEVHLQTKFQSSAFKVIRGTVFALGTLPIMLFWQNANWTQPNASSSSATSAPTTQIQMQTKSSLCVDVYQGSTTPGAQLNVWLCNQGDPHETFAFHIQTNGTYAIVPQNGASPELCLDVNNSAVVQNTCVSGSKSQQWVLQNNQDGTYSLENLQIGKDLAVPADSAQVGTPLILSAPTNNNAVVKFTTTQVIQPLVTIQPAGNSAYCFDVFLGSVQPHFALDLWGCDGADPHETFALVRLPSGAFILQPQNNASPPLCLDTNGPKQKNGVQVVQNECDGSLTQKFTVISNPNGTTSLVSLNRQFSLSVADPINLTPGQPLLVADNNGSIQSQLLISGYSPQKLSLVSAVSGATPYCMDIERGSQVRGFKVDVYRCDLPDSHETFGFHLLNNGLYNLVAQNGADPSLCLDANGVKTGAGVQIVQNPCSGVSTQQWNITANRDGSYSLLTPDGKHSIQMVSGSLSDGSPVILGSSQPAEAAEFFISGFAPVLFNTGDGQYVIGANGAYSVSPIFTTTASIVSSTLVCPNSGPNSVYPMSLNIDQGSVQPGYPLEAWAYFAVGLPSESFAFNYNSNGTYTIYADNGVQLCLDTGNGANQPLMQNTCTNNNPDQQFHIEQNPDGTYSLLSSDRSLSLEIQATPPKVLPVVNYAAPVWMVATPVNGPNSQQKFNLPGFTPKMKNPQAVNPPPHGQTLHFTMPSKQSKIFPGVTLSGAYDRDVWIYIPSEYVPGTAAPFMVVQDAAYMDRLPAALDYLIYNKELPAMIAIFANSGLDNAKHGNAGFGIGGGNEGTERNWEYDTMNDSYARWVNDELLPQVVRMSASQGFNVQLTSDPNGRGALGLSSGGTASFNLAWFTNSGFTRVIAFSGSFTALECLLPYSGTQSNPTCSPDATYPNGAASFYANGVIQNSKMQNIRTWMSVGSEDLDWRKWGNYLQWSAAESAMAQALADRGYHYHLDFANGTYHCDQRVSDETLPEALKWVWRGFPY